MRSYMHETIEILQQDGPLLISVDADMYEIPMKTFVRENAKHIVVEEIQSKYNSNCVYSADREFCRVGFLYQAIVIGDNGEQLKSEAIQLVEDIQKLENCFKRSFKRSFKRVL